MKNLFFFIDFMSEQHSNKGYSPTTASSKMNNETFWHTVYDRVINLFAGSWINCSNVYTQGSPISAPPSANYFLSRKFLYRPRHRSGSRSRAGSRKINKKLKISSFLAPRSQKRPRGPKTRIFKKFSKLAEIWCQGVFRHGKHESKGIF